MSELRRCPRIELPGWRAIEDALSPGDRHRGGKKCSCLQPRIIDTGVIDAIQLHADVAGIGEVFCDMVEVVTRQR